MGMRYLARMTDYGIIFANDLMRADQALEISKEIGPHVDGIKFGVATLLEGGPSFIYSVKKVTSKPILADLKVADIGFWNKHRSAWEGTNAKIVKKIAEAGVDYVICHGIVGTSSLQECVDVAHAEGIQAFTLPFMTSVGAELFFGHPIEKDYTGRILGNLQIAVPREKLELCKTISDLIIVIGEQLEVDGYIGPANVPPILRHMRLLTNRPIFGPGIGRQAQDIALEEQLETFYRICGRNSSVIVGSLIYAAEHPVDAARRLAQLRDRVVGRR